MVRRVSAGPCLSKAAVLTRVLQMQMGESASSSAPAGTSIHAESRVRPTLRLLLDPPKTPAPRQTSAGGDSRCVTTKCRWAHAPTRNKGEMAARNGTLGQRAVDSMLTSD